MLVSLHQTPSYWAININIKDLLVIPLLDELSYIPFYSPFYTKIYTEV